MIEQLVEFETAKLAKEKGFGMIIHDSLQYYCQNKKGQLYTKDMRSYFDLCAEKNNPLNKWIWIPAPSQAVLQEWIRDVHNIHISIQHWNAEWMFTLQHTKMCHTMMSEQGINSYIKALELGLQEALKHCKK